jgi:hypothetical protein
MIKACLPLSRNLYSQLVFTSSTIELAGGLAIRPWSTVELSVTYTYVIEEYTYTGEGSNVLKRSGLGGGGGNDDGVLHGVVLLKGLDELGNGGTLLANGDVDTVELLGLVVGVVPALLVEHGVESDGGLSGLTITDDQLTLSTANGDHGVDGLETSLHGLVDRLAGKDTGSLELGTALLGGLDGALAIDGVTEGVDNTAEQSLADGNVDLDVVSSTHASWCFVLTYNLAGTLDGLTLLDQSIGTEKHDTDLAGLQVHAHALDAGGEPAIPRQLAVRRG